MWREIQNSQIYIERNLSFRQMNTDDNKLRSMRKTLVNEVQFNLWKSRICEIWKHSLSLK